MMRRYTVALVIWGLVFSVATATAALNGRIIEVKTTDIPVVLTPIEVPISTDEAPSLIHVVDQKQDVRFPATLRNGTLTFVVSELPMHADAVLTIVVAERTEDTPPRVIITKQAGVDILDVTIDGTHFTSYHYGDTWSKPFLWPVNTEGGVGITRDYPMETETTPRISRDHPHHKSFWSAYGAVNGHDFWGEGTASGIQRSGQVAFGSGDAYGWIRAANVWEDKDGNPQVDEIREYRFYATPETTRLFDVHLLLKASYGAVLLSDTKEGGMVSARMRPDISHARAVITNAHGDQGEANTWGKPSPWCDFSGNIPDVGWRGLSIFDHPTNLRHPSSWHVRNYGLMGANAFGYSHFIKQEHNRGLLPENGDYTIAPDEALSFDYRIYVHSGDVEHAKVAQRYEDYVSPPRAVFVE